MNIMLIDSGRINQDSSTAFMKAISEIICKSYGIYKERGAHNLVALGH